jgi:hypothetical protein
MSEKIVQLNEEIIKSELKELVRSSVEETLNGLLEAEAKQLTNHHDDVAQRHLKVKCPFKLKYFYPSFTPTQAFPFVHE